MTLSQANPTRFGKRPFLTQVWKRLWLFAGGVSVRTKILGIVLALMLLLGVGMAVQARSAMRASLLQRLEEQSVSNGRDLAARATDLILINDLYALHELVNETQVNNPDIQYAFVLDAKGQILAHTFGNGFPPELVGANSAKSTDHHQTVTLQTDLGQVRDTAVPIFEGKAGTARIGMSEASIQAAGARLTRQLLVTLIIATLVGLAAAVLLTWIVTRPILELKEATQAVGLGDFSHYLQPWAGDEIGALATSFNIMTTQLAQAEAARQERDMLRTGLLNKVITAQEEERKRIARELHDETGQALTSLLMRLQKMGQQCPVPELKPQIEELRQLLVDTLDDVHNLALELRPSALDDLGLAAALRRYVQDYAYRYPSIEVDLALMRLENVRLPTTVATALYRIVQESLTNIIRHAEASTASIFVERRNGRVRVIIEDNGIGFDPSLLPAADQRLGIYGMRERAELLAGTLTIESKPGHGTCVIVEVPI